MSNIEDLYVSNEPREIEINGVVIKYRELSGVEYTEIADELNLDPQKPDSVSNTDFVVLMLGKCIIEPEGLDVKRLKADVLTKLSTAIQSGLNLAGGLENLNER